MGKIDFCHEDEDINYDETKVCTDREEVHAHGNVQEGKEKNALSLLLVYDEADGYEPSSFFSGRKQVIYRPEVHGSDMPIVWGQVENVFAQDPTTFVYVRNHDLIHAI